MATTTNKESFAASTAITCTITSLGISSARDSASVDNTSGLYLEAFVSVVFTIASGTTADQFAVNVYAYASEDGSNYASPSAGTDASLGVLATPTNLNLIGVIPVASTSSSGERTYVSQPLPVSSAYGGTLPPKWGIAIENRTGVVFSTSTTSTAQKVSFTGVYTTNS